MKDRQDVPGTVTIACGESLGIAEARAWHARLGVALDAGAPALLEAGQLQRVDAAGLQLLTAFLRAARGRGMSVSWQAPSAALRRAAALTGLAQELDLPVA